MDIVLLIMGIIIIILLVVVIIRTAAPNKVEFPALDSLKTQLDTMKIQIDALQKDNRDSQSSLRQELSANLKDNMTFLSEQLTGNQNRANDQQSQKLDTMSQSQRQQLEIVGQAQLEQLTSMNKNIQAHLQQLETRFSTLESNINGNLESVRTTMQSQLQAIRDDNTTQLDKVRQTVDDKLQTNLAGMNETISGSLKQLESRFATLETTVSGSLENVRTAMQSQLQAIRDDNTSQLDKVRQTVDDKLRKNLESMSGSIASQMQSLETRFATLETNIENNLQNVRTTVDSQLKSIRDDNNKQLEQIRGTVDEKLQTTLENKMNESFKLVSERLEQVYKGLGEMQTVAQGVGDLKKVLSNVKTRGILGEIQLGAILKEILTADQYDENVATIPGSANRVEFAVKMPGMEEGKFVYLPIDSKFNGDKFARLQDAYESGDKTLIANAKKELVDAVKSCAKDICTKYIEPPYTTQFAVMFLPVEGLYAEIVNTPGLVEELQRTYKINAAGPSTMAAMLNSLKMGFQTLAIQKRSGEVWKVLTEVKGEFAKFEKALEDTKKSLQKTQENLNTLVGTRTNQMNRKLNKLEQLDFQNYLLSDGE